MPKRSEPTPESIEALRSKVVGLGERSFKKSYFPQLQARISDLSRFRALLDQMSEGVLLARLEDDRLVYLNAAGQRLLGLPSPPPLWTAPFSSGQVLQLREAMASDPPAPLRFESCGDPNAVRVPVEIAPSRIELEGAPHVVLLVRDLRAIRAQEQQIHLLSRTLEQSPVSVVILDQDFGVEYVNDRFERTTGYDLDKLRGQRLDELPSGRRLQDSLRAAYPVLASGEDWEGEIRVRRVAGTHFWARVHLSAVRDAGGGVTHYVGFFEDITEQRRARERIRHLAFYDPLTGLPNRRLLLDGLRRASTAECAPPGSLVAVHFLDLDHFKNINDLFGHPMGDRLLRAVAKRLLETVRESDLVARLGGDEFAVLQIGARDRDAVEVLAQRISQALRVPFSFEEGEAQTGVSVGVSVAPAHAVDPEEMMKRADLALYDVKQAGRGHHRFYDDGLGERAQYRAALSQELDHACFDDELELDFQPVFALGCSRLVGFEALVRWRHPRRGRLPPGEFIQIAEDFGQIVRLGAWVMRASCRAAQRWRAAGLEFEYVSVNVSGQQFRRPELVPEVQDVLRSTGLPPSSLQIEITESVLMSDVHLVRPMLEQLRALGVRFAIDDFGTGFSSLLALKRLPIDALKIAQEFVRDMLEDAGDEKIVRASVQLARQLGLTSIAEGAESMAHVDALAALGCDQLQGYALCTPVPEREVLEDPRIVGSQDLERVSVK